MSENIKCAFLNIGNASNDYENGFGLYIRIPKINEIVNSIKPDVIFFLEANRPTKNEYGEIVPWDNVANQIKDGTGLVEYICVKNTEYIHSHGISCFINPERIQNIRTNKINLCNLKQKSIGLKVTVMMKDKTFRFMAVHFPHNIQMKSISLNNLEKYCSKNNLDFICGDFNTFADLDGYKMLNKIKENFKILTQNRLTYVSFPHGIHYHSRNYKFFHKTDKYNGKGIIGSAIDHVIQPIQCDNNIKIDILNPYTFTPIEESSEEIIFNKVRRNNGPLSRCSDHFPIVINLTK